MKKPPRLFVLQKPMQINVFAGHMSHAYAVVHAHVRLHNAVYEDDFAVVDRTPGDLVLGLPFREKYHRVTPRALAKMTQDSEDIAHLYLGVPPGQGLRLPPWLQMHPAYKNKSLREFSFVQRVPLKTQWTKRLYLAKPVPAEAVTTWLDEKLPYRA
jgi:hypothetical protein